MKSHLLILLFCLTSIAQDQKPRRSVTLEWEAKPGASQYEIQISTTNEMEPIVFEEILDKSKYEAKLEPGTYYYRLRFFSQGGKPGPWSEVEGFIVNFAPPKPVFPKGNFVFSKKIINGITIKWTKGVEGTKSQVEVSDEQGAVLSRSADNDSVTWMPPHSGKYRWRAGYQTISGVEWGEFESFEIRKSALPNLKTRIIQVERAAKWRLLAIQGALAIVLPENDTAVPDTAGNQTTRSQPMAVFGELHWNPELNINQSVAVRGLLGGGFAQAYSQDNKTEIKDFFMYKTALMISWAPKGLWGLGTEFGPGAQYRFFYKDPNVKSEAYFAAHINFFLKVRFLGIKWVDRIHAGYEIANLPDYPYKAIKLATILIF